MGAMSSNREKMLAGELYQADDAELVELNARRHRVQARWNDPARTETEVAADLAELLGAVGDSSVIRPPFHVDYGCHLFIGEGVFVNYGGTFLDCAEIRIGDATQIGPNVSLLTPDHPRDPVQRRAMWESAHPITIGENVWIGGGATICPGVTIGDDAIVGAGAVVTSDVPTGATVVGVPARVLPAR